MYQWGTKELMLQIGLIFQYHRLQAKLSQLQLANELNLSSNHIGRIERGETNPTLENIVNFCNYFEIDMLYLFTKLNPQAFEKMEIENRQLKIQNKNKNRKS